eukprot:1044023-Prymnesium_polylepis.3
MPPLAMSPLLVPPAAVASPAALAAPEACARRADGPCAPATGRSSAEVAELQQLRHGALAADCPAYRHWKLVELVNEPADLAVTSLRLLLPAAAAAAASAAAAACASARRSRTAPSACGDATLARIRAEERPVIERLVEQLSAAQSVDEVRELHLHGVALGVSTKGVDKVPQLGAVTVGAAIVEHAYIGHRHLVAPANLIARQPLVENVGAPHLGHLELLLALPARQLRRARVLQEAGHLVRFSLLCDRETRSLLRRRLCLLGAPVELRKHLLGARLLGGHNAALPAGRCGEPDRLARQEQAQGPPTRWERQLRVDRFDASCHASSTAPARRSRAQPEQRERPDAMLPPASHTATQAPSPLLRAPCPTAGCVRAARWSRYAHRQSRAAAPCAAAAPAAHQPRALLCCSPVSAACPAGAPGPSGHKRLRAPHRGPHPRRSAAQAPRASPVTLQPGAPLRVAHPPARRAARVDRPCLARSRLAATARRRRPLGAASRAPSARRRTPSPARRRRRPQAPPHQHRLLGRPRRAPWDGAGGGGPSARWRRRPAQPVQPCSPA